MVLVQPAPFLTTLQPKSGMKFTKREQELLRAAAQGLTDKQIGENLAISIETVAGYWRCIRLKFQASSRTECVARFSQQFSESLVAQHELESCELQKEILLRTEAQARELAQKEMLSSITTASMAYISRKLTLDACLKALLADVLNLTRSDSGFVAELTVVGSKYTPRPHAELNCSLDSGSIMSLVAEVVSTRKATVANDSTMPDRRQNASDKFRGSGPLLAIPILSGGELVGIVGLGNRLGGYPQEVIDYLNPMVATCAHFIDAARMGKEREAMRERITDSEALVRDLVDRIPAGLLYETPNRSIAFVNQTLLTMFGIDGSPDALIGTSREDFSNKISVETKGPKEHLDRVGILLKHGESVRNDVLDFADGRRYERDFVVITSRGITSGYMWCYRDITRRQFTRKTDAA